MKIVNDIRIFNKINRKYYKRNSVKHVDYFKNFSNKTSKKKVVSYWFYKDWLGFIIKSVDVLLSKGVDNIISMYCDDSEYDKIKNALEKTPLDSEVTLIKDNEERSGIFKGFILTNRSIYYVINDRKNTYSELFDTLWTIK